MAEEISIDPGPSGGGGGGSGPFGVGWPVLLGGAVVVAFAFVLLRRQGGSAGSAANPLAIGVMLADIQGRQELQRQDSQVNAAQASQERAGYAAATAAGLTGLGAQLTNEAAANAGNFAQLGGQLTNLEGLTTSGFAEAASQRADYYSKLAAQLGANTSQQAQYYAGLATQLSNAEKNLGQRQDALGQHYYQGLIDFLQPQLTAIQGNQVSPDWLRTHLYGIEGALNGATANGGTPAGGPAFSYAGWQQNFGANGPNQYDVNRDNVVDVQDWGILKTIFGDRFGTAA